MLLRPAPADQPPDAVVLRAPLDPGARLRDGIHDFAAGEQAAMPIDFALSLSDDTEFSCADLAHEPADPLRRSLEETRGRCVESGRRRC